MTYRAVNGGMAVLFLVFAGLQLNDPDPIRWIVLYGLAAGYSSLGAGGVVVSSGPVVAYGALTAGLAVLNLVLTQATDQAMGDPRWGILAREGVRESLGLLLVSGWMFVLGVWSARQRAAERGGEG